MIDFDEQLDLGNEHMESGEWESALDCFTACIGMEPENIQGYINRGNVYRAQGRLDAAVSDYNEAIRIGEPIDFDPIDYDRDYSKAFAGRGDVHCERGEYEAALRDYFFACDYDPCEMAYYADAYRVMAFGGRSREFLKLVAVKSMTGIPVAGKVLRGLCEFAHVGADEIGGCSLERAVDLLRLRSFEAVLTALLETTSVAEVTELALTYPMLLGCDFFVFANATFNNEGERSAHLRWLRQVRGERGAPDTPMSIPTESPPHLR